MAAFTARKDGDFNTQDTWNDGASGYPDGADDTADTGAYAITAATAIVCGAITVNAGGSLDTGTAAATITSITTAGTGIVTIGSGGCTFAGVLNNAGTGLLTINGACTGITVFTPRNCTINAAITITNTCTDWSAGETVTINANVTMTKATTSLTIRSYGGNSILIVGPGVTISAPNVTSGLNVGGQGAARAYFNGTQASPITLSASGTYGGIILVSANNYNARMYANWVNAGCLSGANDPSFGHIVIQDCEFSKGIMQVGANTILRRCFVWGTAPTSFNTSMHGTLEDCAIGYKRNGDAVSPLTNGIAIYDCTARNVVVNATTIVPAYQYVVKPDNGVKIDNYGYVTDAMISQTANPSALRTAAASFVRGVGRSYLGTGLIERSTTNPPTGKAYHARLNPNAYLSNNRYLFFSLWVPIQSGDTISVTAKASRSGTAGTKLTSACADCQIDPEGAWFTGTSAVAWDLVKYAGEAGAPDGGYYDLPTCSAASASGGTGAKGTVRVLFRLKEYQAGQFLDIGDVVIACGGVAYNVTMQNWANGMPVVDAPVASGGAPVFGGHVSRRV